MLMVPLPEENLGLETVIYEFMTEVGTSLLSSEPTAKMKNPYDYWWDTEKKAFIEWNVVEMEEQYFQVSHRTFS